MQALTAQPAIAAETDGSSAMADQIRRQCAPQRLDIGIAKFFFSDSADVVFAEDTRIEHIYLFSTNAPQQFYSEILKLFPNVRGIDLDAQTRCTHYHSPHDIVAIKMKCCGVYYACKDCHTALTDHPLEVWPRLEWDCRAVLCGNCGAELTIKQYLECGSQCPVCGAAFNPGCSKHHQFYFENE